ncbi:MAG: hypothetical protein HZC02_03120 [Candidatus Levybacteria bacterium]|nr:hypothetical protein [Candidatus Levybacteria bacterium]
MLRVICWWIVLVIFGAVLCGISYVMIQQQVRQAANDPQIQLSEDIAASLSTKEDTVQIAQLPRIDIGKSLYPFVISYDGAGEVVLATGLLNGKEPVVPEGVFAYTKEHGENRFTWEPQKGVRIAAVMKHFTGRVDGYILAGRSLREVEKRENLLFRQFILGWIGIIVLSFPVAFIISLKKIRINFS